MKPSKQALWSVAAMERQSDVRSSQGFVRVSLGTRADEDIMPREIGDIRKFLVIARRWVVVTGASLVWRRGLNAFCACFQRGRPIGEDQEERQDRRHQVQDSLLSLSLHPPRGRRRQGGQADTIPAAWPGQDGLVGAARRPLLAAC
eukprot:scaffold405_cov243-Pinguiococcus_pyrenoidosus.AAC.9